MIDYNLCCDECGRVIDGSKISAARVRRQAKAQNLVTRVKGKDVCWICKLIERK